MNEVKHIHLGRQSFTISVEAHKELRIYLDAIAAQMGEKAGDVVEEVELRMAELLTEHGIGGEKVILPKDIKFLKEQLGEPREFKDDDADESQERTAEHREPAKRLFRDTDNAMIGGVAAGLAAYFGIEVAIVRLLFVLLVFLGGGGFILYLLLFLVIPPAETSSERLQMRGKAVTVNSLKDAVDRADFPGTAHRTGTTLYKLFSVIFKLALGVAGVFLALMAAMGLIVVGVGAVYLVAYHPTSGGALTFPVGSSELLGVIFGGIAVTIVLLLAMLAGVAMARRKWQLPGWTLAALFGVLIISASVGGAMAFKAEPGIRARLDAMRHTDVRNNLPAFKNLQLSGRNTEFYFVPDTTYSVTVQYTGNYDPHLIETTINGDTLKVTTDGIENIATHCSGLCVTSPSVRVTIHAPEVDQVHLSELNASFSSQQQLKQSAMTITADQSAQVNLAYVNPTQTTLSLSQDGSSSMTVNGLQQANESDQINFGWGAASITRTNELDLSTNMVCSAGNPAVWLNTAGGVVKLNGKTLALQPMQGNGMPPGVDDINVPSPAADYCVGIGFQAGPFGGMRRNYNY
ncbi:MAG TPA: PspC domain-containing protein [Candidatus Saccharimonadales bacterium]|nr:PspC domain-containing protein [Candidatus Saccharimonadales bacterium]